MKKFKCSGHIENIPVTVLISAKSLEECLSIIDTADLDLRPDPTMTTRVLRRVGAFLTHDEMLEFGVYFFYFMGGMIIADGLHNIRTQVDASTAPLVIMGIMTILLACVPISIGSKCLKCVKTRATMKERVRIPFSD
jgi:hypothetical protein